ncbi:hypothetical protein VULLAG_LOCUS10144 [Vulpes lagopus]
MLYSPAHTDGHEPRQNNQNCKTAKFPAWNFKWKQNVSLGTLRHLCQHIGTACLKNEVKTKQKRSKRYGVKRQKYRGRDKQTVSNLLSPWIQPYLKMRPLRISVNMNQVSFVI